MAGRLEEDALLPDPVLVSIGLPLVTVDTAIVTLLPVDELVVDVVELLAVMSLEEEELEDDEPDVVVVLVVVIVALEDEEALVGEVDKPIVLLVAA
jgi:hypothetical protein